MDTREEYEDLQENISLTSNREISGRKVTSAPLFRKLAIWVLCMRVCFFGNEFDQKQIQ